MRSRKQIANEISQLGDGLGSIAHYHKIEIDLLLDVRASLQGMKKQEKDYWETWKQAKSKEVKSD